MEPLTCPTCATPIDHDLADGDAYQCGRCATTATARLIETPDGPIWFWQQMRPATSTASAPMNASQTT